MDTVNSIINERVTFNNNGITMVGILHYHEHMDRTKKYPAIVCTHLGYLLFLLPISLIRPLKTQNILP